jgi:hypothetical protein
MEKLAIPCECGCSVVVFMELDAFKEDPQEFFAEFYTMVRPPFRERFKTAWAVFRDKDHYLHDVVIDKDALVKVRDFLEKTLPKEPT